MVFASHSLRGNMDGVNVSLGDNIPVPAIPRVQRLVPVSIEQTCVEDRPLRSTPHG